MENQKLFVSDLLNGPHLVLRSIDRRDAAYVYALRSDPTYNRFLSRIDGTIKDQAEWIDRYKAREASGEEFYFVVERIGFGACGLVRLYDISDLCFSWGSWILDYNKPPKAALESAVLIYRFAFDGLGLQRSEFEVMHENLRTISFHRRFGAIEIGKTASHVQFVYPVDRFRADLPSHLLAISGSKS